MCTPARKKKRPINDQQSKKTTGAPFIFSLSTPPGEIEQKSPEEGWLREDETEMRRYP